MRHSLKYRMAIAAALVVTLVVVVRGSFSQYYAYTRLNEVIQDQQDTLVKLVADQLDEKLEARALVLRRLARTLAPVLDHPTGQLRRLAADTVDMPEHFNAVFMVWPDGSLAFSTAVPDGTKMTVGDRDYFRSIANGADFAVSDLLQGKHSAAPGVILAVPLRDANGHLLGVVGGALNLSSQNFLRELAHHRVGVTGYYCLVSAGPNPRYAMHPDTSKVLTPARAVGESCGAERPASAWEVLSPQQPVVARRLLESNGWEVISVLPAAEAYAPLLEARQRSIFVALASLLLAALAMWATIRHLLAPLEHLHRTVRRLGEHPGAMADLTVKRNDEIGELAGAFSEVMTQLSEREAALKAAKDSAAASEKRLEAIANHVPDFVAFIDASERFAFVNRAYARHFGLPAEQIVGLSLRELWGTPEYVANKPYLDRACAGESITFTRESADGAAWEVTFQPAWNDAQDVVTGLHMFARNVTGERQKLRTLEAQTLSDHLTGLLNRKGFDRRLQETMARADACGHHARAGGPGPRRLQGRQRHPWPPGGRSVADCLRRTAARVRAGRRRRGADRRRRVRDHPRQRVQSEYRRAHRPHRGARRHAPVRDPRRTVGVDRQRWQRDASRGPGHIGERTVHACGHGAYDAKRQGKACHAGTLSRIVAQTASDA